MSYKRNHIKQKINNAKPKRPVFTRLWFWIAILIVIIIICGFYFLFFYQGLQVENVIISGNNKVLAQNLKNTVEKGINEKVLWFLDSKSILFINKNRLNTEILKDFPVIDKTTIVQKFPQTLLINVEERKPIGDYCDSKQGCFLIDKSGVVFEPAQEDSQNVLTIKQILENKSIYAGEDVVNEKIINGILEIQKDLRNNFQIDLKTALLADPIRLDITTNENWQIYFSIDPDSDIKTQLTKLNLLLNGDITQTVRKTLQYIDLRFKDRAYYK